MAITRYIGGGQGRQAPESLVALFQQVTAREEALSDMGAWSESARAVRHKSPLSLVLTCFCSNSPGTSVFPVILALGLCLQHPGAHPLPEIFQNLH